MQKIMVNWVKEDEELLEPYEWSSEDDIEILEGLKIYRVDEESLYAFIYGCMRLKDPAFYNQIFAVSDTKYCVIAEIDSQGTLIYRSVPDYKSRKYINSCSSQQEITTFSYAMYDEGMAKEYGLTRKERLRKQYIETTIDTLYIEDYETFLLVCNHLGIQANKEISLYIKMKQKLEKGYTFIHELLYAELSKIQ